MKVRFLADADLNKAFVSGVLRREPSLDFLTAQAAGLRGMSDPEVLALAAENQRILVLHDVGTMPASFALSGRLESEVPEYSSSAVRQQVAPPAQPGLRQRRRSTCA